MEVHAPVKVSEAWIINEGQTIAGVHLESECEPPCPVHAPSNHRMRDFKLIWRNDRGIFERICPDGVGHPDPDQMAFFDKVRPDHSEGVHGCDGCCSEASDA